MQLNKILLPIELAAGSTRVVRQAAFLARHFSAQIVLLHVVRPMSYPPYMLEGMLEGVQQLGQRDYEQTLMQRVETELQRALQVELAGVALKRVLRRGDIAHEIEQTARDEAVDLIMMCTHSHDVIYRFLLGSVTAKVLHRSDRPLWTDTVAECAPAYRFGVQRLLCALDLGPHSASTLASARQVAAAFNARLTLVHVTPSIEIYGPGGSTPVPRWREELVGGATTELASLQLQEGTDFEVIIDSGNVSEALNRAALKTSADLLVLGRLPPGGHLGANGAGYALIRDSSIPVLSL